MSGYGGKTAEELRAKAIHALDLARMNAHDTVVAANLQSMPMIWTRRQSSSNCR
jgi:hypothetical protein